MLQSVQTALLVFETVAKAQPIGVTELAARLKISKSTAQRCLQALNSSGWIKADETVASTRWIITSKAFGLGQRVSAHARLRDVAMPEMSKLWEKVHESVHLVVAEGRKAILLEHYESPSPVQIEMPRVAWAPLHTTPSGKVLMAYMDQRLLDEYLAQGLESITRFTVTEPEALRKQLDHVRRDGWSLVENELIEGYSAIAAPVFDWNGRAIATLAITVPTARFPQSVRKKYIGLLVESADVVSRKLKEA